ncbi:DUF3040 domain-containing protein [Cellulomonas sp. RIT-PI-Y]|jgi:hypothetical protein|uniref:DUF3040 domain-containing protein n=1 Tax=Cellulomonas sp. RIT-PI-Y TaxID=3035297 RepID=UPI0021D94FA8|nr:DUF3040 domain-containing protein [Cellulomonas sp. RIT-PI-Y]
MPLSEYEQRVLEQMERQLTSDDPRLATTLTSSGRKPVLRYILGGVGALVGLLLLVIGAAASLVWLGVLGFIVMFAAVAVAFTKPRKSGPAGVVRPDGSTAPRPTAKKSSKKGFMDRIEERWDRRSDGGR